MIRVLIADDSEPTRRGLRIRLERASGIRVVGEAGTGRGAVEAARAHRPDVVLMDLQMPGGNGLAAIRELAGPDAEPPLRVIALTNHVDDAWVLEAVDSGAAGYLLKLDSSAQLIDAVRTVAAGGSLLSSQVARTVLRELAARRTAGTALADVPVTVLTRSERTVLGRFARGVTDYDDLAAALHLSPLTARNHIANALKKTGLADRTQLALWAVHHGLDRGDPGS